MIWNSRSKVEVKRAMGRIINNTFDYMPDDAQADVRAESRCDRILPLLIVPVLQEGSTEQPNVITGFSRDLSSTGVAVLANAKITEKELILVIGDATNRGIFRATCQHSRHIGYGCYQSGVELTENLSLCEYGPLVEYIQTLEAIQ